MLGGEVREKAGARSQRVCLFSPLRAEIREAIRRAVNSRTDACYSDRSSLVAV